MKMSFGCRMCERVVEIEISATGLAKLQRGELIQNALPELTADEREIMISQTCGDCFDYLCEEN